jgi:hypothetical protein
MVDRSSRAPGNVVVGVPLFKIDIRDGEQLGRAFV